MRKKGVELSFNIIIILIILVIVLVIIAAFFTGAFSKLIVRLNQVDADNIDNAISDCRSKCLRAQNYESVNQKTKSGYCRSTWKFDVDKDGQLDEEGDDFKQYNCWEYPIEESCTGVENYCDKGI